MADDLRDRTGSEFRPTTADGFRGASDLNARPSLGEALTLRSDAMALVRRVLDDLNDDRLEERTAPLVGPGWPDEGETFRVRERLLIVLNEEWQHRRYAERDLAVLEEGP